MSKTERQGVTPPSSLGEDGNLIVDENASIVETSTTPTVEELVKKLEKLNAELNKLKTKDKMFKSTTKRTCYNYGKHGHFIANYPFEHRDDDDDKKKYKPYKKDKGYKRSDKPYKKKSYGEAHIG
jgi:hypothetical protein